MATFDEIKKHVLQAEVIEDIALEGRERARLACMNLHYQTFALIDFGMASRTIPLFAAEYHGETEGRHHDYAEIVETMKRREENVGRKTRHTCTNYLFRLIDENTASAISLVAIYLEDDSQKKGVVPLTVADCGEKYSKDANGIWRIAYRYLQPVAGAPR
jgi:hypothetical protein